MGKITSYIRKNRTFQAWLSVFIWVLLIYSTLGVVRPVCEYLREVIPFSLSVNFVFVVLLLAFIIFLVRQKPLRISNLVLGATATIGYAFGLAVLDRPEERIHFIQYGVLAFLIFRALTVNKTEVRHYFYAIAITVMLGWVDEVIQYYLPTRYYDNRDVVLNGISAVLALMITRCIRKVS